MKDGNILTFHLLPCPGQQAKRSSSRALPFASRPHGNRIDGGDKGPLIMSRRFILRNPLMQESYLRLRSSLLHREPPLPAMTFELLASGTPGKSCHLLAYQSPSFSLPTRAAAASNGTLLWFHRLGAETQKTFNLMEEKMKKKNETKATNKPVHRIRFGAVSCSVFLNKTKDGTEFPSAVISRSYKSGDTFKESNSYGARHLTELADLVGSLRIWMQENHPEAAN